MITGFIMWFVMNISMSVNNSVDYYEIDTTYIVASKNID